MQSDPEHGRCGDLHRPVGDHAQAFEAALTNSLPQQLSFIGLPCTCTLLSFQGVPGYTVEAQLKQQTGLKVLQGEAPAGSLAAVAPAPAPACGLNTVDVACCFSAIRSFCFAVQSNCRSCVMCLMCVQPF